MCIERERCWRSPGMGVVEYADREGARYALERPRNNDNNDNNDNNYDNDNCICNSNIYIYI